MLEFLKGAKLQYGDSLLSGALPGYLVGVGAWQKQGRAAECDLLPAVLQAIGPGILRPKCAPSPVESKGSSLPSGPTSEQATEQACSKHLLYM